MAPIDPAGPTGKLSTWISGVSLTEIPESIRTRSKYLILDGIACALVGAHLPWSETAAETIFEMEPEGSASVFGWDKKITPIMAALLNSTFIQGFELDDWHGGAPLHSNSIVLPALFAAAEHLTANSEGTRVSGEDLLLSTIVGYETGPRVGLGLHGSHMLTMGWHSGPVFGPSAAAASVSKLFRLPSESVEDALGIACTQACGLMSAQFESEVKRMQHGFAARNGLFAALLARKGYVGIKKVYERPYGGFLATFSLGNSQIPRYLEDEIAKDLGSTWQTEGIFVKAYASMAGTHPTVDGVRALQEKYPEKLKDLSKIASITLEMGEAAFHHGGWKAERPLTATGAQMSNAYVSATQLVDNQVLTSQFRHDSLERNEVWALVDKTTCLHNKDFNKLTQRVTITFNSDSEQISHTQVAARGMKPPLSNDEVREKWRNLVTGVINKERRDRIEEIVLNLEKCEDIKELIALLVPPTHNPIA